MAGRVHRRQDLRKSATARRRLGVGPVPPIRVLVMGLPPMLGDVVRTVVARDPALLLVGDRCEPDRDSVARCRPDVVVTSVGEGEESEVIDMLASTPKLRVLGVVTGTGQAALYEMRPHRMPLGELGLDSLAAVLAGRPGRPGRPDVPACPDP